jgi:hypothetical protein
LFRDLVYHITPVRFKDTCEEKISPLRLPYLRQLEVDPNIFFLMILTELTRFNLSNILLNSNPPPY